MSIDISSFTLSKIIYYCMHDYALLGFAGTALFTSRFFVQWIASEKQGKSVVPIAFWYFSVGGGGLLLIYSVLIKNPVYILGQAGGLVIYLRNLYLIHTEHSRQKV